MVRIHAENLIPGKGPPLRDGCVVLEQKRIRYAGPRDAAPETPSAQVFQVTTVMPGLWDCHGHFLGSTSLDFEVVTREPLAVQAARAAKDAETVLQAGFTSVREVGGLGIYLKQVVNEGILQGPHIYSSGAILSPTGGHADVHGYPLTWLEELRTTGGVFDLCDGVPECLKAVRLQLRRGADLIKVCTSGGVLSELDNPHHQQYSDEELHAMVGEAARAERITAAHCHGEAGIRAALRTGCRTLEHGSFLDPETARMAADAGAILVPARYIVERMLALRHTLPAYVREKADLVERRHQASIRLAHAAGVRIAAGSDAGTAGPDAPTPWSGVGEEFGYLVAAGLSPLDAIEAGTANGPLTLGALAPKSGQLCAGYDADVIGVEGNPVADIHVLAQPARISHVWKEGRLMKGA